MKDIFKFLVVGFLLAGVAFVIGEISIGYKGLSEASIIHIFIGICILGAFVTYLFEVLNRKIFWKKLSGSFRLQMSLLEKNYKTEYYTVIRELVLHNLKKADLSDLAELHSLYPHAKVVEKIKEGIDKNKVKDLPRVLLESNCIESEYFDKKDNEELIKAWLQNESHFLFSILIERFSDNSLVFCEEVLKISEERILSCEDNDSERVVNFLEKLNGDYGLKLGNEDHKNLKKTYDELKKINFETVVVNELTKTEFEVCLSLKGEFSKKGKVFSKDDLFKYSSIKHMKDFSEIIDSLVDKKILKVSGSPSLIESTKAYEKLCKTNKNPFS